VKPISLFLEDKNVLQGKDSFQSKENISCDFDFRTLSSLLLLAKKKKKKKTNVFFRRQLMLPTFANFFPDYKKQTKKKRLKGQC
jgi:hypothetical protein